MKQGGRKRLANALAAAGAVLKRQKKHLVYALPNGKTFTCAATPGDRRADDNAMTVLRHALGTAPRQAVVNPPRERRLKPGRADGDPLLRLGAPTMSPLAAALQATGIAEHALRLEIAALKAERAAVLLQLQAATWRADRLCAYRDDLEARLATACEANADLRGLWVVRAWTTVQRWLVRDGH